MLSTVATGATDASSVGARPSAKTPGKGFGIEGFEVLLDFVRVWQALLTGWG